MPCRKLKVKARWEQDRWLSYLPEGPQRHVTHEQRIEFLRYDSHGGEAPKDNPILEGKHAAAVADTAKGSKGARKSGGGWLPYPDELVEMYFDGSGYWPGGLPLMEDYLRRVCGIGPLRRAFGDEAVARWLRAFLMLPWGG